MATCVIESQLQKGVVGSNSAIAAASAAASLRPAAMPTEFSTKISPYSKPGTSAFEKHRQIQRGVKRSANSHSTSSSLSWTDDDNTAVQILSMVNRLSSSTISGKQQLASKQPIITSSNDPSDVLLHQLSQVCEQAQKTVAFSQPKSSKLTINTVLEADRNSSTLKSTKLANHFISCFIVGGEIRLCSPQIHSVIMKDVHEDDITHWVREYNIVDHLASGEQLTSLKLNRAIPPEAGTCGLMTKTNAERLVGALIDPVNYRILPNDKKDKFEPILIEHDCFGGCEGRLYSSLFPGPCVECTQCKCLMTTEAFCRHSHIISSSSSEQPLCHWGFDAANWSKYIRLHQLAENDQESSDRFYSLLKNCSLEQQQQEDTIEDNLEVYAKKSMISAPFSALAAQLLAQQQQFQAQQQHASTSSSVAGYGGVPQSSSLPTSSFIPPPSSVASSLAQSSTVGSSASSSTVPQQSHGINLQQSSPVAAAAVPNLNQLSQLLPLLQQQQSQQILAQIQTLMSQQQQQQQQTPLNAILAYVQQHQQQQQQFQTTLNALRNGATAAVNSTDESDIPRKRAHTISDPSSIIRAKSDDFSLSSISFGMLSSDQQLMSIISQVIEGEGYRRVTELINLSIAQRVQPIADDNSRLRKELQKAQDELKVKNDILARIAAAGLHHQQSNNFPTITTPSALIPGSSSSSHHHNLHHQQHPLQIVEQDSDIEIDDASEL
jgi:hypothetical protein